jgi:hypothetical protein
MRRTLLAQVSLAVAGVITAATGGAVGGASGNVVRVAAPRRVEVYVPGGRFLMGVDDDAALIAPR